MAKSKYVLKKQAENAAKERERQKRRTARHTNQPYEAPDWLREQPADSTWGSNLDSTILSKVDGLKK